MKAVFIFSGQGAQAVGMGKDLYESSPEAAAIFDEADKVLGYSIKDICFNGPPEKLTESAYCQPAIFTTSCACLAAYKAKNPDVKPLGAGGLSLGEFAALCTAGVFSFADGVKLVAARGKLMDEACRSSTGAMASVLGADPDSVSKVCQESEIDVANLNSPGQIVISGASENVKRAIEVLKEKGIRKIIPLNVAGAYHSRLMKKAGEAFATVLANVSLSIPQLPIAQNYTGAFSIDTCEIRANLVAQVAGTVRWEQCYRNLIGLGADTAIEFGPGNVLTGLAKRMTPEIRLLNVNSVDFQ